MGIISVGGKVLTIGGGVASRPSTGGGTPSVLNVPLFVNEVLPSGVTGANRTDEVVTGGIPLPEDSGITSISQLGLDGVAKGQFRALGYWPNGNIKWVLLDFPLSVTAGSTSEAVSLVDGAGNFGGSDMATDNGATITVATGAATFTIKKANFNIFDVVTVGATTMVSTGNAGRLSMIGTDDTDYASSNDASSTASIEENGPVRAVVKATGALKSAGGTRLVDFTMRLHFYTGTGTVKGSVELRNATDAYNTNAQFKSVSAIVPVSLGATKSTTFSINGTPSTTSLGSSETAYLFQGHNNKYITYPEAFSSNSGYYWLPPLPGTGSDTYVFDSNYTGTKVQVGSTAVNAFGTVSQYGDGAASLDDSTGKGVTVGFKRLAAYWPGGFEFTDAGGISIELYSKQNPYNASKKITLPFLAYDRRVIAWNFHTSGGNSANVPMRMALEYPLAVRADFSHYLTCRAIYGQAEIPTVAEETSFYTTLGKTSSQRSAANPAFDRILREGPGATGGGTNQTNVALAHLVNWLRTGYGGWYALGEARTLWGNNGAFPRSDSASPTFGSASNYVPQNGRLSGGQDWEHMHLASAPLYYYLSGDEETRAAVLDMNDYIAISTYYPLYPLPGSKYLRAFGWKTQLAALGLELAYETGSGDTRIRDLLATAIAAQMDAVDGGGYGTDHFGRHPDRGYLYWEDPDELIDGGQQIRHLHALYDYIYFEGAYHAYRVMASGHWNYARALDVRDHLTGLAQFHYKEWIEPTPLTDTAWTVHGFPYSVQYNFYLDTATPDNGDTSRAYPYDFGRGAAWGYQHMNDATFVTRGKELVWETPVNGFPSQHCLQVHHSVYTSQHSGSIPTWKDLSLSVTDNGGGSYTLSWTVPSGATEIQIKHAGKTIVDWLGFNRDTRAYTYAPASYAPWYAATNITNNPAPAGVGTTQSITLTGLGSGRHFAAKYLS